MTVRGYGAWHRSTSDWSANETRVEVGARDLEYINGYQVEMGNGNGFGGSIEYWIPERRLGIEFGMLVMDLHADLEMTAEDNTGIHTGQVDFNAGFRPAFVGLNYHLLDTSSLFDPYVGVFVSQVFYGDADIKVLGQDMTTVLNDKSGVGINFGADFLLGQRSWLVSAAFRYLMIGTRFSVNVNTIETDLPPIDIGVNPYMLTLGIAHRF